MIRAELADAPDLDALRDGIGLVSALMATGGVAVVDPQLLMAFDAQAWRVRGRSRLQQHPRHLRLALIRRVKMPRHRAAHAQPRIAPSASWSYVKCNENVACPPTQRQSAALLQGMDLIGVKWPLRDCE